MGLAAKDLADDESGRVSQTEDAFAFNAGEGELICNLFWG